MDEKKTFEFKMDVRSKMTGKINTGIVLEESKRPKAFLLKVIHTAERVNIC